MQSLAQSHTVAKWWMQNLNSGLRSKACALHHQDPPPQADALLSRASGRALCNFNFRPRHSQGLNGLECHAP